MYGRKAFLTAFVILAFASFAYAADVFTARQGGTGIGTATVGDIAKCLKVLTNSPFAYELGTCGGGGGNSKFATSTDNTNIQPNSGQGLNVSASSTFSGQLNVGGLLNASSTSLFQNILAYSSSTLQNTSTGILRTLGAFYASTTALFTEGFTSYSSSTLQNFTAQNATTSNATTTALAITGLTGNHLVASNGTGGLVSTSTIGNNQLQNSSLTVNGTLISLGGAGTITAASSTLLADNNTFTGSNVFSGLFSASSTSLFQNILAYSSSTLQDFTFANATGSQATTTNFQSATAKFTNFILNNQLFTSLLGTGLINSGGALTLDTSGDWTGMFDGQEGTYYLSRTNHTGTQLAATISDFTTTVRGLFSASAPITYDSGTGAFSVSNGAIANAKLANSSLTVNGTSISLGGSGTITAASSTLLADNNTFTSKNVFSGLFSASSTALFGADTLFGVNTNGVKVGIGATTSPFARLSIAGDSVATTPLVAISTSSISATTTVFMVDEHGRVIARDGIATSTSGISNNAFFARPAGGFATSTPGTNVPIVFTGSEDAPASFSAGAPGTIILPYNTAYFIVELWGGGGGGAGGGSAGSSYAGGGGSGAGYSRKVFYRNSVSTFYYTIGAGGVGGVCANCGTGGTTGSTGGVSYFNSSSPAVTNAILTANGGGGGGGNGGGNVAGGSGSGGDVNLTGYAGGASIGLANGGNSPYMGGGVGGPAPRGAGGGPGGGPGYASNPSANGQNGASPGGGGGGAGNQNTGNATGGTGGDGGISIEYYTY
jgi:hypothetical protein